MTLLALLVSLGLAFSASAQGLLTPGAAQYPSPPLGRHFLDKEVAQCVIARPCPYGDCVILLPCTLGAVPTPTPPIATPPIPALPPSAQPKEGAAAPVAATASVPPAREPIVIQLQSAVPCPPAPAASSGPKPAKKRCPSC
jgi:hypothetical protein